MSCSQPNLAIKKDIGKGSPRVGEVGHGTSFATCPLAWAPFLWLGPDTSFAHTAVGREGGLQAQQLLPCPLSSWPLGCISRSFPSTPQPKAMTKPLPGQWHHSSGLSPAPGVCPLTNGRASQGSVSQWQLFLGSPGPMMLPPIPFVPPLCVPIAEKGTGTKGVGIMGSPILALHLNGPPLTYSPSLIVLRALEDWDLALGINLS